MIKSLRINQTISQVEGNIVSDMDGETVMLSIKNGKYYNLGSVGGDIWALLKEPKTINELVAALQEMYEVQEEQCREEINHFLAKLEEEKLIVIQD